jgi:serine/threonine protein kinase
VAVKTYALSTQPDFDHLLEAIEQLESICSEINILIILAGSRLVTELYEVICDDQGIHLVQEYIPCLTLSQLQRMQPLGRFSEA